MVWHGDYCAIEGREVCVTDGAAAPADKAWRLEVGRVAV